MCIRAVPCLVFVMVARPAFAADNVTLLTHGDLSVSTSDSRVFSNLSESTIIAATKEGPIGGRLPRAPDDTWTATSAGTNTPSPRCSHTAVWTGSRVILWGPTSSDGGGLYDPATDSWMSMSSAGAPSRYPASATCPRSAYRTARLGGFHVFAASAVFCMAYSPVVSARLEAR